ncbi:MAG: T9SS type A sorting domain-containing protein [Bacteroidota bacterium]
MKRVYTIITLVAILILSAGTDVPAQRGGPSFSIEARHFSTEFRDDAAAEERDLIPLPNEWLGFAGVQSSSGTLLRWTTASEHNSAWFKIECRRVGTTEWQVVDVLPAAGESTTPRFYSWLHQSPPQGELEYRLRQIDKFGNDATTGALRISASKPDGFSLSSCYPNPANTETIVAINTATNVTGTLIIADLIGRVRQIVFQGQEMLPGTYNYRLDISALPVGKYILRLTTSEGVSSRRLVITR